MKKQNFRTRSKILMTSIEMRPVNASINGDEHKVSYDLRKLDNAKVGAMIAISNPDLVVIEGKKVTFSFMRENVPHTFEHDIKKRSMSIDDMVWRLNEYAFRPITVISEDRTTTILIRENILDEEITADLFPQTLGEMFSVEYRDLEMKDFVRIRVFR